MELFTTEHVLTGSVEDVLAAMAAGGLVLFLVQLRGLRRAGLTDGYSAPAAWLRAGAYFSACLLAGWATGVTSTLLRGPFAADTSGLFVAWTGLCIAVVVVGYAVIWARGTLTHGRDRSVSGSVVFGLLWGLFEAQLLLALYALAEEPGWGTLPTVGLAFLLISAWQGGWHAAYWDIHVAPEHNIEEWNLRKVAFAHTPNLVVTLTHLAWFGSPWLFVAFQTLALTLSTWHMRFPALGSSQSPGVTTSATSEDDDRRR